MAARLFIGGLHPLIARALAISQLQISTARTGVSGSHVITKRSPGLDLTRDDGQDKKRSLSRHLLGFRPLPPPKVLRSYPARCSIPRPGPKVMFFQNITRANPAVAAAQTEPSAVEAAIALGQAVTSSVVETV